MVQAKRRVSYILPSPSEPVPRLQLPPHGSSRLGDPGPLLTPYSAQDGGKPEWDAAQASHPRHRLGVASFALDTSTHLMGRGAPEGILYSGGRDGLIMAWELGIPMKKRAPMEHTSKGRWEMLTGWEDDVQDDEVDDMDDKPLSDGDILGDVTRSRRARAVHRNGEYPLEREWETDMATFNSGSSANFRQCTQAHTDWVNDIILCNYNQNVVSASSDGTIKSWSPHSTTITDPSTIGSHGDYVRCLANCREQNWIASGSFDRTIKLWDLTRPNDPLMTLNPADASAPKSSVYALAVDPCGRTIASGSPERVVRLWDPRTGKRTGKLVGHTDNIRAILISDDSKYLLTGSADASIKLWSLSSQKCLHTFTHHSNSVWSLYSDHPQLEVFYSGDKDGLVCRVDVDDCGDMSDGECIVLCHDRADPSRPSSEGINRIMVMDDNLMWTASGSSTIRRWNIPQRKSVRPVEIESSQSAPAVFKRLANDFSPEGSRPSTAHRDDDRRRMSVQSFATEQFKDGENDTKLNGIPYDSLIKLASPTDAFTPFSPSRIRDPEVATLYSAASVMSVPRQTTRSVAPGGFPGPPLISPLHSSRTDDTIMAPTINNTSRAEYEDRELAEDATPLVAEPDDVIAGDHGLVRSIILNDRIHVLTVDTAGEVAVWDIVRAVCKGRYCAEDVSAASHAGSITGSGDGTGDDERERSPREALEAVRERIEGEAVIPGWCAADTKAGVLTIHISERCFEAEVFADEVGFADDEKFNDESKLNLGRWVLTNLFIEFIKEELRRHPPEPSTSLSRQASRDLIELKSPPDSHRRTKPSASTPREHSTKPRHRTTASTVICSLDMVPAISPRAPLVVAAPLAVPLIPLPTQTDTHPISPLDNSIPITRPKHQRTRSGAVDTGLSPLTPGANPSEYFTARARQVSLSAATPADDTSKLPEPPTPSTPSGLMGRLRNIGKFGKRPTSDASTPTALSPSGNGVDTSTLPETAIIEIVKTPFQELLHKSLPLKPPPFTDAPPITFPSTTTVIIAEEASQSYSAVYRSSVPNLQYDLDTLEDIIPLWVAQCVLFNSKVEYPTTKISFVLMPWNKDPDVEPLPELLNTAQSKLTASRYLRIRKVLQHVQDKLDKVAPGSSANSVRSSTRTPHASDPTHTTIDGSLHEPHAHALERPRPEDVYEILCQEALLPLGMTLAAVKQYVWRSGNELVLHYRRKKREVQHS
ncbi:hypothetical protein CVT24_003290 [Panaeolus cyanescens]|uniref:Uncharacterized protein n=1 Tax=Panaeolus cyanescens TaxID=181874 RepID=A0A409YRB3_9AGAR|nr:hypothetical protein CVT24_003290 [Panaeolus cyanescens]